MSEVIDITPAHTAKSKPDAYGLRSPWLEDFQPAGVKPAQVVAWIDAARKGDDRDLQAYGEAILERDPHARALLQSRVLAHTSLPQTVEAASNEPEDVAIAEAVRIGLVSRRWWSRLRSHLAWGVYYGYAAAELVWDPKPSRWNVRAIPRPNRWFVWDQVEGEQLHLRDHKNTPGEHGRVTPGLPIPAGKIVVHTPDLKPGLPIRSGVMWPLVALHLFSGYALRSWVELAEKHGQPSLIAKEPNNTTDTARKAMKQALRQWGRETSLSLPPGFSIEALDAKAEGHADFHRNLLTFLNAEKSKLLFGQTMTSEDGSSLSQARVHEHTADTIRDADARSLDATLSELVATWCGVNFQPRPYGWPVVRTSLARPEDGAAVAAALRDASTAMGRPLPVTAEAIRSRLGWPEPEEGDELGDGRRYGEATIDARQRASADAVFLQRLRGRA